MSWLQPASSEESLRATWEAVSWAEVLSFVSKIKCNSQLLGGVLFFFFSVNTSSKENKEGKEEDPVMPRFCEVTAFGPRTRGHVCKTWAKLDSVEIPGPLPLQQIHFQVVAMVTTRAGQGGTAPMTPLDILTRWLSCLLVEGAEERNSVCLCA